MERHPGSRVPGLHPAEALADAGETGAAVDTCRALLSETPDDTGARLGFARALALYRTLVTALPETPNSSERIDAPYAARARADANAAAAGS